MGLKQELSGNQTLLLIMKSSDYNKKMVEVAKNFSGNNVIYVTLNKTFGSLEELFKKHHAKTDHFFFIDAISKTIKNVSEKDSPKNVHFVSSPGALTEISLVISRLLRNKFDYLIFDSLTNLLVYEKKAPVAKFVQSTVNKVKEHKTKAIFYALSVEEQATLIQQCEMFVDKVIGGSAKKEKTKKK